MGFVGEKGCGFVALKPPVSLFLGGSVDLWLPVSLFLCGFVDMWPPVSLLLCGFVTVGEFVGLICVEMGKKESRGKKETKKLMERREKMVIVNKNSI